tara:strand:+ start:78 stop:368 length:291 start_codon:yes stop_codon:yes gene_type:complete
MKITKRQLRRIIKEEKARLLNEMDRDAMMDLEARERAGDLKQQRFTTDNRDFLDGMKTVINGLMELPPEERIKNAKSLIVNIETVIDVAKKEMAGR